MQEKQKYPREWWASHIEQWKAAGTPVAAYARMHNLNKSTFHGWIAKLNKEQKHLPKKENSMTPLPLSQPSFVEVTCASKPLPSIELITAKGLLIRFPNGSDLNVIARLISMMEDLT